VPKCDNLQNAQGNIAFRGRHLATGVAIPISRMC
jgi:hypothetical protein